MARTTLRLEKPTNAPARPPPPLPPQLPPPPGRPGRIRAAIAIRWLHLRFWVRRRPLLAAVLAVVIVLVTAAGAYVVVNGVPELGRLASEGAVADAGTEAGAEGDAADQAASSAAAKRDRGNAQWAAKRHRRAIRSYARALAMDPSVADDRMVANLVAALGTSERPEAQSLMAKHRLLAAEPGLDRLTSSGNRNVRWAAARTLDKLGKGTKHRWETVLVLDLQSSECEIRREAVERLGTIGTRRVLPALRTAAEEDKKTDGWFKSPCLGDRIEDAERKILARR